jgi:copper chaperone CopZ
MILHMTNALRRAIVTLCLVIVAATASATTVELTVNGLVCGFCAQGIEKTLRKNAATQDVLVSLEHRTVAVALRPGSDIADADLKRALEDAGYAVVGIARSETPLEEVRRRLGVRQR